MDQRERLIELLLKCEKENDVLSCYNERPKKIQAAEIIADYLLANGVIVPPCKAGDEVYFYKAETDEICLAKVIRIHQNYYTPSMPLWIKIEYESQLIGKQEGEMWSKVFELLCHSNKEELERHLKGEKK